MTWSRIQNTHIFKECVQRMEENNLLYHNVSHIQDMYQYLEDIQEPYSEELDLAVVSHDVVYDNLPNKEQRSAEYFLSLYDEYKETDNLIADPDDVYNKIMATYDHKIYDQKTQSAIIRADLHGFMNNLTAFKNFNLIMTESCELYGIDDYKFCRESQDFLDKLSLICKRNADIDRAYMRSHLKIEEGILFTIMFTRHILIDSLR